MYRAVLEETYEKPNAALALPVLLGAYMIQRGRGGRYQAVIPTRASLNSPQRPVMKCRIDVIAASASRCVEVWFSVAHKVK